MTGAAALERRYRRLLACYPARFRDEHGEEVLAVLLASARGGQRRPGLAESASLLWSGLGMRLRPGASQTAAQGWADALAVFSLAGPVFLLATTVVTGLLLVRVAPGLLGTAGWWLLSLNMPAGWSIALGLPEVWIALGFQVAVAALVLAGLRRWALVATAAAVVYLPTSYVSFPGALRLLAIGVYILELAALLGSPGPRRGRDLVHWGHGVVLLLCAAALVCYWALRWYAFREPLAALLILVLVVAVIARAARAVRLSRYFRLLLAALAYPYAPWLIDWWGDYGWWRLRPGDPLWTALLCAGPVLTALVALITAVRPRRRRQVT